MTLLDELVSKHGPTIDFEDPEFANCKCDDCGTLRNFQNAMRSAIREAVERCAQLSESAIPQLEESCARATAPGRIGVAHCRQSDIETRRDVAAAIRKLVEGEAKG